MKLDGFLQSNEGILLHRALSLDFAISKPGFAVRLDEIPADVYGVLKIIDAERTLLEAEREALRAGFDAGQD